jgi:hypothetical protein
MSLIYSKDLTKESLKCDFCEDSLKNGGYNIFTNVDKKLGYVICKTSLCQLKCNNTVQKIWDESGGDVINYLKNKLFKIYRSNKVIEDKWTFNLSNVEIITFEDNKRYVSCIDKNYEIVKCVSIDELLFLNPKEE